MKIRLPQGIKEQIEKIAAKNNRSMNAEIVIRLQRSLEATPGLTVNGVMTSSSVDEIVERVIEKLDERKNTPVLEGKLLTPSTKRIARTLIKK